MNQLSLSYQHLTVWHVAIILCLTAFSALASHLGKAAFNDGLRPIMPEVMEGRMKRSELTSISFGLSFGFILSVGLSFAISFQLLNPWLLFLTTDILGVMAANAWLAMGMGAIWGVVVLFALAGVPPLFAVLPVDLFGPLSEFAAPVMLAFAVVPILAILYQFGWVRALLSGIVVLIVRQLLPASDGRSLSGLSLQFASMMTAGIILLLLFAAVKDYRSHRSQSETVEQDAPEENALQIKRLVRSLPILTVIGGLLSAACNLGLMTGSDAAAPILQQAWMSTGQERVDLLRNAAVVDVIRGLSFLPLIVATAMATGVYAVIGLTFIFPIGYLSPNPWMAGLLGMFWICVEVMVLRRLGMFVQKVSTLRESADHIRTAMNTMLEFALFIGGSLAVMKMETSAPGMPLMVYILIYAANEGLGRPVLRLAAGPVAFILTGIFMNIRYFLPFI